MNRRRFLAIVRAVAALPAAAKKLFGRGKPAELKHARYLEHERMSGNLDMMRGVGP